MVQNNKQKTLLLRRALSATGGSEGQEAKLGICALLVSLLSSHSLPVSGGAGPPWALADQSMKGVQVVWRDSCDEGGVSDGAVCWGTGEAMGSCGGCDLCIALHGWCSKYNCLLNRLAKFLATR